MTEKYAKTVAAALAETRSKFELAEALATEIPPRSQGRAADDRIADLLAEARDAIAAAGGEPKTADTLRIYRDTALWANSTSGWNFRWVKNASFTAHRRACEVGMSYEDFVALPKHTSDAVYAAVNKPGARGQVRSVQSWTPEQKRDVARTIMSDPDIAAEVVTDDNTRVTVGSAIARHQETNRRSIFREEPKPPAPFDIAAEGVQARAMFERWVRQVNEATPLTEHTRPVVVEIHQEMTNTVGWLGTILESDGITDESLARLIEGGAK